MAQNTRRYLLLLLAALALGFFFYKFRNSITLEGFRWGMVWDALRGARPGLLLLSIAGIFACYAIRAARWMRFSRTLGRTNFWNVYSATLMGFTCTFLLGRAGEPVRPVLIAKKDSLSVPGMFGVYVLERVFDIGATVVCAGAALLMFRARGLATAENAHMMGIARSAGALLLVLLLAMIGFLIYFRYHGGAWLGRKLQDTAWRSGGRARIAALLEGFSDGLQGIRTWGDLGALVAYSAVHWLLVVIVYMWVAHAFGGDLADIDFAGSLLVLAFTMVGSAVQLPGVGGGAQAASFLVFTLIFGVEKEASATAAIVLWLITFASCCLVGLPLLFREGWSMGELKRLARAEEAAGEAALLAEAEHPGNTGESSR
jgi:glycosyltransferase 2 family protein